MPEASDPVWIPISRGLLEPRHAEAMGSAIWVYLVLLDLQTSKDGTVMGGQPITAALISGRLGCDDRTVRRAFSRLEARGYVRRLRSGDGWQMWVRKPKKPFPLDHPGMPDKNVRGLDKNVQSGSGDRTKMSSLPDKNVQAGQKCPGEPRVICARDEISSLPGEFLPDTKESLRHTPPTPSLNGPAEFEKLKRAYPKDALVNGIITEHAFADVVLGAVQPEVILAEVWAGLNRMTASGTPVRFLPNLKDFLLQGRFREAWPREEVQRAKDKPADVHEAMERFRAKQRAAGEAKR